MMSREREIAVINGIDVETERKPSIGVALVIVGIDPSRNGENITAPKLWTIIEKKTKPETEKIAGQISFPGETWKPPEDLNQNIFGAIAGEFSGDDQKINNLWYVEGKSYAEGVVLISGRPADLVVLAYTGLLDHPNIPLATNEVSPNRWMTIKELLNEHPEKVRRFAREFVALEQNQGLVRRVVDDFTHIPLNRVPLSRLLPNNFSSMAQFYQEREEKKDVAISNIPLKR